MSMYGASIPWWIQYEKWIAPVEDVNSCKGCEYYNKPYWSIISPCENCGKFLSSQATNYIQTFSTSSVYLNDKCTNCVRYGTEDCHECDYYPFADVNLQDNFKRKMG